MKLRKNEHKNLQESLALLEILSQSRKNLKAGKYKPAEKAFRDLRKNLTAAE